MSLAVLHSRASIGIHAPLVTVEVHIANGLPKFSIVGLPDTAVKESKERVRGAILNSQFEFPARRITVNLAPADLPKDGGRFDLPIALGILAASRQIPGDKFAAFEFIGELALSGEIRSVAGLLPVAVETLHTNTALIFPSKNSDEVSVVEGLTLFPVEHLLDVCAHFTNKQPLMSLKAKVPLQISQTFPDLSEVKGQHQAKRALEIAAAGGHSLLLAGPPGTGKSMLAKRLPSILPLLEQKEALEVAALMSLSSVGFKSNHWRLPPFRAPHHTASSFALVGGSNPPKPGEISLAHYGVLFLDELTEFNRRVLETLREPIETGMITISRAAHQMEFPAQFQLIAAMNPCPCGYLTHPEKECRCTANQIQRYQQKLSGPFLDRIDIFINVPFIDYQTLSTRSIEENSATVQKRVIAAQDRQKNRANKLNSFLSTKEIEKYCELSEPLNELFFTLVKKLDLSVRGYYRLLKLARTIADLEDSIAIEKKHLLEGASYRQIMT